MIGMERSGLRVRVYCSTAQMGDLTLTRRGPAFKLIPLPVAANSHSPLRCEICILSFRPTCIRLP